MKRRLSLIDSGVAALKAAAGVLCLTLAAAGAHAQDGPAGAGSDRARESGPPLWVRAGTEMSFLGEEIVGIGMSATIAGRQWSGVISARGSYAGELSFRGVADVAIFPITLLADSSSAREPLEHRWEAGVLYGRRWEPAHFLLSASAGLGLAGGVRRGALLEASPEAFEPNVYEKEPFVTIGMPLEAQVTWTPFSFLDLGLHLSGNLNGTSPFGGVGTHLLIGRLR